MASSDEDNTKDVESENENESENGEVEEELEDAEDGADEEGDDDGDDQAEDGDEDEEGDDDDESTTSKKKKKGLKDLNKFKEDYDKRGVIYVARVPPYMKPAKLKHLLSQYGHIHRVYLAPEDPTIALKRKKAGGNRKKNYTEGWVEFADKRIARRVAISLNNTNIGGSKRNYYYDDLWNIKYLKDFKWHNLTEKIAYDKAVKEQKLRTHITQAKKENNLYLSRIESSKVAEKIAERKQKTLQKKQQQQQKNKKKNHIRVSIDSVAT